jgi:hypothetical protein
MKTKNATKKLTLNKKSIAALDTFELKNAEGGTVETIRCTKYTVCIWIVCMPTGEECV